MCDRDREFLINIKRERSKMVTEYHIADKLDHSYPVPPFLPASL